MSASDSLAVIIAAQVLAAEGRRAIDPDDDPVINIATLAYWDGVRNLADAASSAFDGKLDTTGAMTSLSDYAEGLRKVLEDASGDQA